MRLAIPAILLLGLVAGCDDEITSRDPAAQAGLTALATISDGTRGGNPNFHFLPPMVKAPAFTGEFEPRAAPVVRICVVEGGECSTTVAEFQTGKGSDAVRLSTADEYYVVNWHTRQYYLDPARTYRITVAAKDPEADPATAGEMVLGHADVDLVASPRDLVTVESGRYVGVVNGTTLPIKFRIEKGAFATQYQQTDRLDPTVGTLHPNPFDGVWATVPARNGAVNQYLVERDATGIPSRVSGVARVNLARDSVEQYTEFNDIGLPSRITGDDGVEISFEYLGGTGIRITYRSPDGQTYQAESELAAPIEQTQGWQERNARTLTSKSRMVADARAATGAFPAVARVQIPVTARHLLQTDPVPGASVRGTYSTSTSWGLSNNLGMFRAAQEAGDPAGTYTTYFSPNPVASVNDAIRNGCTAWEKAVQQRCNDLKLLRLFTGPTAVAAVCAKLAPVAGPAALIVGAKCAALLAAAALVICDGHAVCEAATRWLQAVVPTSGSLTVKPRASAHGERAVATRTFNTPLSDPVVAPVEFGQLMWLTTDPAGTGTYNQDFDFVLNFLPKRSGVETYMAVEGSDGWKRSHTTTSKDGKSTLRVLRPELLHTTDKLVAEAYPKRLEMEVWRN